MENKIFCYVCYGRKMVKANRSIEYKDGQIITKFIKVHISYAEFVSIVCDRIKVHATSMKMLYTCKFAPTMLVLLEDDEEMRKMFRFNDTYCSMYVTSDTNGLVEIIPPPPRHIKFS